MARAEAPTAAGDALIEVEVVYCPGRGQVDATRLRLPAGATVARALAGSGLLERHEGLSMNEAGGIGIWGRACPATRVLREGDRVEVYRPLQVAPMDARRTRHQTQSKAQQQARQRSRARRAGAEPGGD